MFANVCVCVCGQFINCCLCCCGCSLYCFAFCSKINYAVIVMLLTCPPLPRFTSSSLSHLALPPTPICSIGQAIQDPTTTVITPNAV